MVNHFRADLGIPKMRRSATFRIADVTPSQHGWELRLTG
jgi:hypothetical protein